MAAPLEEKLKATWSPEQITERFRVDGLPVVSFKTIYRWIYHGRLVRGLLHVLQHKGKRQKPTETRGTFAIGRSISDRPKEVRSRETFGHWELDTVVSGRGKSKGCVATLIERKTRLYTAILMPDRTALSMEIALGVAISQYPKGTFLTATVDRGSLFLKSRTPSIGSLSNPGCTQNVNGKACLLKNLTWKLTLIILLNKSFFKSIRICNGFSTDIFHIGICS